MINNYKKIIFFILSLLIILPPFFDGGRNIFVNEVVLLFTALALLLFWLNNKNKNRGIFNDLWRQPFVFLFLFLVLSAVTVIFSTSPYNSYIEWIKYLSYGILFFIVAKSIFEKKEIEILIKTFLGISAILCLTGIYFYLSGSYTRLTSTFWWPNPFAGYLLLSLPLGAYWFLKSENVYREKILSGLVLILFIVSLILTGSRGAFLSLFLVLPFFIYFSFKSIKKNFISLLLLLLFSISIISGINYLKEGGPGITERTKESFTSTDLSSSVRLDYWEGAWGIFKDYPLFGSGMGTYTNIYPQYQNKVISSGRYAHNLYLEMLSESGIFVLILFISFLFFVYWQRLKNLKEGGLIIPLYFGTLAFLIHNGVDMDWHFSASTLVFWLFLGLMFGSDRDDGCQIRNKLLYFLSQLKFKRKFGKQVLVNTMVIVVCTFLIVQGIVLILSNYNFDKGSKFQSSSQLKLAEKYYKKSILLNPNPDYVRQYGIILYSRGLGLGGEAGELLMSEALNESQRAVKLDSFNDLNYELRGRIFLAQNNLDEAEKDFRKSIELNKFKPSHYINLSELLIRQGRNSEASEIIEKLLSFYSEEFIAIREMRIMKEQEITTGIEKEINYLKHLLQKTN